MSKKEPSGGDAEHIIRRLETGAIPRLGFGCGELYPASNRQECITLLRTAFDAGVVWFDTARLYGLGQAEGMLGELASSDRDKMVIVSKAGIIPVEMTLPWRLKAKASQIARKMPGLDRVIAETPPLRPTFGAFSPDALRASVEKSLLELKTDYLDLLLLHECDVAQFEDEAVLDLLRTLRQEGKIRGFGSATGRDATRRIAMRAPLDFGVLQFPAPAAPERDALPQSPGKRLVVTHSVLGRFLADFTQFVTTEADRFSEQCTQMNVRPHDKSAWAVRILARALQQNEAGVVLFSSSKPQNIRASMAALEVTREEIAPLDDILSAFGQSVSGGGARRQE